MARFEKFEEIKVWQLARELVGKIYKSSKNNNFTADRGLTDQMQRASVSVMSNIAEGFERENNKVFMQYLYIAKGSAGEVRSQLYVASDLRYITSEQFDDCLGLTNEISKMIGSLIKYLKSNTG